MKIVETKIHYVIFNIIKSKYYSGFDNYNIYKTIYKFDELISNAITYDTRKEANEDISEWIDRDGIDKYTVKKVKVDYSIN